METLPTEMLQEIYKLACTDSGHTGRSLSLVSKRIRDTSLPFKYYSFAVTGLPQMKQLALALSQCTHDITIAHLCVGFDDILEPEQRAAKHVLRDPFILPRRQRQLMSEEEFQALKVGYLEETAAMEALTEESETLFIRSFLNVIDMCKSTLQTLSVTLMMSKDLPRFSLPRLSWLMITSHIPDEFFNTNQDVTPLFPSLKCLHLGKSSSNSSSLGALPRSCPRLTHIRIRQSFELPQQLIHLLSEDGLPHLEKVIVDVSPIQDRVQSIMQNHIASTIRKTLVIDGRGTVRVTDIPTVRVAQEEWEKVIIGENPW